MSFRSVVSANERPDEPSGSRLSRTRGRPWRSLSWNLTVPSSAIPQVPRVAPCESRMVNWRAARFSVTAPPRPNFPEYQKTATVMPRMIATPTSIRPPYRRSRRFSRSMRSSRSRRTVSTRCTKSEELP